MAAREHDGAIDPRELRRRLLAVHRELLAGQVIESERATGHSLRPGEVLSAAMEDPRFAWLREISGMVADLDAELAAARSEERQPDLETTVARAKSLVAPPDGGTSFGRSYLRSLQRNPGVVIAHCDLTSLLGDRKPVTS